MLLEKGANAYLKEENKQTILYYLAKEGTHNLIEVKPKLLKNFCKLINMISMIQINTTKTHYIGLLNLED